MRFLDYFSSSYDQAQEKFLSAAGQAGATLERHVHPERGPEGQELVAHVARIGSDQAEKLLLLTAGTHGAEGLAGSGCLVGWLREGRYRDLPVDTAAVLVHFVNPYGVAHRCRQTEGNVDLNRNFLDHDRGDYPVNKQYSALHEALLSDGPESEQVIADFTAHHGKAALNKAILTGQYDYADGLFYGGRGPVWSNGMILDVVRRHGAAARTIAHIDYHTGLGPYGYGILINTDAEGSAELKAARTWFGETLYALHARPEGTEPEDGPSAVGDMCGGIRDALAPRRYIHVALEVGTYDIDRLIAVYRADCRFRRNGGSAEEHERIRRDFQNFFYPQQDDWKEMVWWRSEQVTRQALRGLGG